MNRNGYRDGILTVMVVLLVLILLTMRPQGIGEVELLNAAYAQPQGNNANWVLIPGGADKVRWLVLWDKTTNTIYEYGSGGKVDNTWVMMAPGQPFQKR